MCEPISAATALYMSLAMGAVSAVAQKVNADNMADANRASAEASYNAQMEALKLQREQIDEQASDKMSDVAKQEQAKMAQLRVAAGESGVTGVSVDRASNEIAADASQDIVSIKSNRNRAMKQTTAEGAAMAAQTMGRVNSVQGGNWGATALQIGGSALSSYSTYSTRVSKAGGGKV